MWASSLLSSSVAWAHHPNRAPGSTLMRLSPCQKHPPVQGCPHSLWVGLAPCQLLLKGGVGTGKQPHRRRTLAKDAAMLLDDTPWSQAAETPVGLGWGEDGSWVFRDSPGASLPQGREGELSCARQTGLLAALPLLWLGEFSQPPSGPTIACL